MTPSLESRDKKAVIFNIARYSIHDGPGIRTSVFFKGCPLSCKWCHNPEGIDQNPREIFNADKCISCGECGQKNKIQNSITNYDNRNVCPAGAREIIGYEITAGQLMDEIKKDSVFYEQSHARGGVTFTGGEPFFQADFLFDVLRRCKDEYIQTAIDTSGYCDTRTLQDAAKITSYFLYDIKFIDSEKHARYCGVPNSLILENLRMLSFEKTKILIRIPVIPGVNNSNSEVNSIFQYIKNFTNIKSVHLLPYHNLYSGKYKKLEKESDYIILPETEIAVNSDRLAIEEIIKIFSAKFRAVIGC